MLTAASRRICSSWKSSFWSAKSSWVRLLINVSRMHGTATTAEVLDRIKAQGFKYSTRSAITVAVCDAVIPPQKKELMEEADTEDRKDYQAVPQRFDFQ